MPLGPEEREYVLRAAVDILRHSKREKLLAILGNRLEAGDYPEQRERELDEVVLAIASAINEKLVENRG
jgi:hypothetical protein